MRYYTTKELLFIIANCHNLTELYRVTEYVYPIRGWYQGEFYKIEKAMKERTEEITKAK
jgi:hypothetical protein